MKQWGTSIFYKTEYIIFLLLLLQITTNLEAEN